MTATAIAPEVREAAVETIAYLDLKLARLARDLASRDPAVHRNAAMSNVDRLLDKRLPLMRARDAYDDATRQP